MTIETATYISGLNSANPAATDPKSEGDDHIRLLKSTVKATFPNVSGAVTPTHTELNYVAGVTSAIQTQINTKTTNSAAAITGGTINNASVGATTPSTGAFTTLSATGNATLGDAAATDVHAINGATTVTVNSASAALTINQTGAGNALVVEDSASTDSTPFVIDQNGNVVVGNTAVINTVSNVTATTPRISINGTAAIGSAFASNSWGSLPAMLFARSAGAIGVYTATAINDVLGRINFATADGVSAFRSAASIDAISEEIPTPTSAPGALLFKTSATGSVSPTERMRIDSAGNVGIGTSTIFHKLEVEGGTTALSRGTAVNVAFPTAELALQSSVTTSNVGTPQIIFASDRNDRYASIGHYRGATSSAIGLSFFSDNGSGVQTEALRIDSTQLVNPIGGLQISKTAVTAPAATDGNVYSGTYTPTLTNTTNITSSTAFACQYMRVGNVVTVSGKVDVTATATGNFILGLTLPVTSNLATGPQLSGTFASVSASETNAGAIYADTVNDRATLQRAAQTTGSIGYYFHFTYQVI